MAPSRNMDSAFQSSPGPKAGRCRSTWHRRETWTRCFNPRPARRPGAAISVQDLTVSGDLFQSSPGPKAGRCRADHRVGPLRQLDVSILARPEGRALPRRAGSRSGWTRGFNPRPARRPGAAGAEIPAVRRPLDVSILARPEGRALLGVEVVGEERFRVSILARPEGRALRGAGRVADLVDQVVSILARPEGRALPSTPPGATASPPSFNPRPARRPGAASSSAWPGSGRAGFNPRPARRPGAARMEATASPSSSM